MQKSLEIFKSTAFLSFTEKENKKKKEIGLKKCINTRNLHKKLNKHYFFYQEMQSVIHAKRKIGKVNNALTKSSNWKGRTWL